MNEFETTDASLKGAAAFEEAKGRLKEKLQFEVARPRRFGLSVAFLIGLSGAHYWVNDDLKQAALVGLVTILLLLCCEYVAHAALNWRVNRAVSKAGRDEKAS